MHSVVRCRPRWEGRDDGLGEMSDPSSQKLERTILALLDARQPGATICPSEVARHLRPDGEWRELMEPVRCAARRLCARGGLEITQRGRVVDPTTVRGPIRLRKRAR